MSMSAEQRFSYVKYDEQSTKTQQELKEKFIELTTLAEKILPPGRPLSLVLTHLEEAYMWTGKGIRDGQILRQGKPDEQPERSAE
jgi:hypothetical protein